MGLLTVDGCQTEDINNQPDFIITGSPHEGRYSAMNGDINDDDYEDLIIYVPSQINIYLGSSTFNLTYDYYISRGKPCNLFYANINNDDYSDPIISFEWDEYHDYKGKVLVYYGNSVFDTIPEFTLVGENEFDYFGRTGYDLGDVNLDCKDDILLATASNYINNYANIYTLEVDTSGIDNHLHNEDFMLSNYPNPFFSSTNLSFSLKHSEFVNLSVYNIQGKKVKTIVNKKMKGGEYEISWDGKNENRSILSSGIYFIKLKMDNYINVKKIVKICY